MAVLDTARVKQGCMAVVTLDQRPTPSG